MKMRIAMALVLILLLCDVSVAESAMNQWFDVISSILNESGSCEIKSTGYTDDEYTIEQGISISYNVADDSTQAFARFLIDKNGWFQPHTLDAAIFQCIIPPNPSENYAFCDMAARIPMACILKEGMPEDDYDVELIKIKDAILKNIEGVEDSKYEYYFPNGSKMWIDRVMLFPATQDSQEINCLSVSVWY